MPTESKLKFSEWRKYEIMVFKRVWKKVGSWLYIRSTAVILLTAIYGWYSDSVNWPRILRAAIFGLCVWMVIFLIELIWKLLREPALMAKDAEEKLATEKERASKLEAENRQLQDVETRAEAEAAKRKTNKEILALYLKELEDEITNMSGMGWFGYDEKIKNGYEQKLIELEGKIKEFLSKNVGYDKAVLFASIIGVSYPSAGEPSSPLYEARLRFSTMLGNLNQRAKELKQILKELG